MTSSRSALTRATASVRSDLGEFEGRGQADGAGDVLGARTAAALLPAAVDERFDRDPAAQPGEADALGRADLVAGERQGVDAEAGDAEVEPAGGLHGVGVERDAWRVVTAPSAARSCTVPISLFAYISVTRAVSGRIAAVERVRGHDAVRLEGDEGHLEAVQAPEVVDGLEHRLVLGRRR